MSLLIPLLILALVAADDPTLAPASPPEPEATCQLSLPEAIRIGLDNSETVRLIYVSAGGTFGGNFRYGILQTGTQSPPSQLNVHTSSLDGDWMFADATPSVYAGPNNAEAIVARLDPDVSVWRFKADVMAHLRSIEQTYWALSFQHANLASLEAAVRMAGEILKREQANFEGGRNSGDIAEAERQLENLKLSLVTAKSNLLTAERQLRKVLGLPAIDDRRIVLTTAPSEEKVEPEWNTIRDQMFAMQPDIALQRERIATADLQAAVTANTPDLTAELVAKERQERDQRLDHLRQLIGQTTHELVRCDQEVVAGYRRFQSAQRVKVAAQRRLDAQRAFDEEGRITVDRMLDAISRHADATSQEAQSKASYNTSIAALEEAKGTLLIYEGVTIVGKPSARKRYIQARDQQAGHGQFHVPLDGTYRPQPTFEPPSPDPVARDLPPNVENAPIRAVFDAPTAAPKAPETTTYKLRASVAGLKLIDVEVEVNTPTPK